MRSPTRPASRLVATLALAALLLPLPALAQDAVDQPSGWRSFFNRSETGAQLGRAGNVTFDVVILRPLQVAALAVGSALFVPCVLMTGWSRDARNDALELFVTQPAQTAFKRPLGDF